MRRDDPRSLLDADGVTASTDWNGAESRVEVNGSTVTVTTAGGRTIGVDTDSVGSPIAIRLPGLPAVTIERDAGGRPIAIRQGARSLALGYAGPFVSSITDPLGRTTSIARDGGGRPTGAAGPSQSFGFSFDPNGNLTNATSPQAAAYSEATSYTPVDLVESFTLPAGTTSVSYNADREGTGGASPYGALAFDDEGKLTAVGSTSYAYDTDDYLTAVNGPDGSITYGYGGGAAPRTVTIAGAVPGTIDIGRNAIEQPTSIAIGGHTAAITIDPDGVVSQVGALSISRDAATFATGTTLQSVTDSFERNPYGEPTQYGASHGSQGELFTEHYTRDAGGRITQKTVRIANAAGGIDTYTAQYGYDDPGRLEEVKYNGETVSTYQYDGNGNLLSGAASALPRSTQLFFWSTSSAETPSPSASWDSTAANGIYEMGTSPHAGILGSHTAQTSACAAAGDTVLVSTFVSAPLAAERGFETTDRLTLVIGAGQDTGGAMRGRANVWAMDHGGGRICDLARDWQLSPEPIAAGSDGPKGHIGTVMLQAGMDLCAGAAVVPAGARIVTEIGFECTEVPDTAVGVTFWQGGNGPMLSEGASPHGHQCGRPGYLEISGSVAFEAQTPPAGVCEDEATAIEIPSRRLISATVNGENQVTDATFQATDGITHTYSYGYDTNGALAMKIESGQIEGFQFDYDVHRSLRQVRLPDGRIIRYGTDALQRQSSKEVCDSAGQSCTREYGLLYGLGLAPIARLDANNNVADFYIYADHPTLPAYMERGGEKYRIIGDHLGSLRLVVNASTGEIKQRVLHDEHGNVVEDWIASGWDPVPFGYAGGIHDRDTGLVRFGTRDYDPEIGRFTATDPVGFEGGDGNLYAYVGNDPINRIDPSGLDWVDTASNFAAGFGDTVSLGATYYIREYLGTNSVVDPNSRAYSAGEWTATAHSLAAGGAGVLRNALSVGGRSGSLLTRVGRGVSRLYKDRRQFATVSRQYWKANGGAGGKHLHHWFKPHRAGGSNAGWNLLELPGRFNSWMGYSTTGRVVEAGLRVAIPGSVVAGAAQGVNWGFHRAEWQAASE